MKKPFVLFFNLLAVLVLLPWSGLAPLYTALAYQNDGPTGVYRVSVTYPNASGRARLDTFSVQVLQEQNNGALILVTESQLATLARLQFHPHVADELGALVEGNTERYSALTTSLMPMLTQASALHKDETLDTQARDSALTTLLSKLTPEQRNNLIVLAGQDSDNDGLTDTEEGWWCTDPNNPNSDGDPQGHTDGEEITTLLDFTVPRNIRWGYGPPFGPPAAWPDFNGQDGNPNTPACNDGDWDTVPDFAEVYMVGSNTLNETTDNDKFDDGQELFGLTYCPGGVNSCGYGNYPRTDDWNYIKANMPNWVLPPGDNLFVAAFPVPEVSVVPGSWTVTRVTVITTEEGTMAQTTNSYETSVTEGQSTSIANTETWNEWEEVSEAVSSPIGNIVKSQIKTPEANIWKMVGGAVLFVGGVAGGTYACIQTAGFGCYAGAVGGAAVSNIGWDLLKDGWYENPNGTQPDSLQPQANYSEINYCSPYQKTLEGKNNASANGCYQPSTDINNTASSTQNIDLQGLVGAVEGIQYSINQQGDLLSRGLHDISYAISQPRLTETHTNGKSWGGAQTVTNEVYEEHTITEGQAFTTGQNWSTAWAVDSSHAADLTFTYNVENNGTEYAREITGLVFNVYLGDAPNPIVSYPAWQQFPGGKLLNVFPGNSTTFTSTPIPLTLDQMRRIDLGESLTVVLEDFSYGIDELFYQDAVNGGLTLFLEDGVEDHDELVDTYVIPTWGTESVQDVLTRYFPSVVDMDGNLTSLWTPEFNGITPPTWNEHFLSEIAWWNIYQTCNQNNPANPNDPYDCTVVGGTSLQNQTARAGDGLLFRFNRDSDRDGYQDRVELRYGTDPNDPASHPQPEILAGYVTTQEGNVATVELKVANLGTFDAYGIDAVMYAPDNTVTIGNNTVGGNGRVGPGQQVAVGSLILPPDTAAWGSSTAQPYAGGSYTGDTDRVYTFTVGTPGVVGQGNAALNWTDGLGASGSVPLGSSYHAPLPITVTQGIYLGFDTGTLDPGTSFTVDALTPRDTFTYTINAPDYTPPVIVLSFSDPQGSHRFITPVQLSSLAEDLTPYRGLMLPDVGVQVVPEASVNATGQNTTSFIINSPDALPLTDAHLYLNFVSDGTLVAELDQTLNLQPGPTIVPVNWSTSVFTQTYDPDADNILIAFWTDAQDNIIDSAARPLNSFTHDPTADATASANSWNFGSVPQGTLLNHPLSVANTGYSALYVYGSGTQTGFETPGLTVYPGTFQTLQMSLDTAQLSTGPFNEILTFRTSDPEHPTLTVQVSGTITSMSNQALAHEVSVSQPWNQYAFVPGPHNLNEVVTFNHNIVDDPIRMHPLYVYTEDGGTLFGVGEYGPELTSTASAAGHFGNGSDGNLIINNGETIYIDDLFAQTGLVGALSSGENIIGVNEITGFETGDIILIHQSRGDGIGNWEMATITSIDTNIEIQGGLTNNYLDDDIDNQVQVVKIPQFSNCEIQAGGTLTVNAWNGNYGGILAIMCSSQLLIEGTIDLVGRGLPQTPRNCWGCPGIPGTDSSGSSGGSGLGLAGGRAGGGGGGGGNAYEGGNGTNGTSSSPTDNGLGGAGGISNGTTDLSQMILGGGGGQGGSAFSQCGTNVWHQPGNGGAGGGLGFLSSSNVVIDSGNVQANGENGEGTPANNPAGGSGGGAGGSVLIRGRNVSVGADQIDIGGGSGGIGNTYCNALNGGDGGSGSVGRIHIDFCDSLTGSTNPPASTEQITCDIVRQLPGSPNTELTLPADIATYARYQIPYGQRGTFDGNNPVDYSITLPKRHYTGVALDALFENLGASSFNFTLDVGANGSVEWNGSGTQQPAILSSPELTNALNSYMNNASGNWGDEVVVPIRMTLNTTGDVFLMNFNATPGGDGDLKVAAGDLLVNDTTPATGQLLTLTATAHNIGNYTVENVIAAFFAGDPTDGGVYLGSGYLASLQPGGSGQVSITWTTTGYTGLVDVYVMLDAAGQIPELSETNNSVFVPVQFPDPPPPPGEERFLYLPIVRK